MFAATEMADPLLEPHGFPDSTYGFYTLSIFKSDCRIIDFQVIHGYPSHMHKMKLGWVDDQFECNIHVLILEDAHEMQYID